METPNTTVLFNSFPSPAGAHDDVFKEMYAGTKHKIKSDIAFPSQILSKEPVHWCEAEGKVEADSLSVYRVWY